MRQGCTDFLQHPPQYVRQIYLCICICTDQRILSVLTAFQTAWVNLQGAKMLELQFSSEIDRLTKHIFKAVHKCLREVLIHIYGGAALKERKHVTAKTQALLVPEPCCICVENIRLLLLHLYDNRPMRIESSVILVYVIVMFQGVQSKVCLCQGIYKLCQRLSVWRLSCKLS